ncbi:hypothetical protein W911_15420 [Hyphomicrobium nitrativorans NL23]|uniref:DUF4864 domain-containing protein n=1 Tax=Hyphomicrobium nitrativorans NL23 TaxID=1029756 RepID=V5SHQ3_9HYPH|nr:hypothetical protein [Hyphomicrobium nitrativorans]AHB49474.1 hypothetical protein W911_15420 [Hyphomicrobium nitrativorans NL23]
MRTICCLTFFLLGAVGMTVPAMSQQIVKPELGSALRAEILDAARPVFERETGGPVEFVINTLNVLDTWAYGNVRLQRPGGGRIDWSRTKYAEADAEGMFDPAGNQFLLRKSDAGEWMLVEYALGPTDVAWDWWRQQLNLPEALFTN